MSSSGLGKTVAIIATKNGFSKGYLDVAIRSILYQDKPLDRIILVDDGSTDGTGQYVSGKYTQIEVLNTGGIGLGGARNYAISHSQEEFICFLDDDDEWEKDKTKLQLKYLQENQSTGMVFGETTVIDRAGRKKRTWDTALKKITTAMFFTGNQVFGPSGTMIRRSVFDKAGGFDLNLKGIEDLDFWLRASVFLSVDYLPIKTLRYRVHANQMTQDSKHFIDTTTKVLLSHKDKVPTRVFEKSFGFYVSGVLIKKAFALDMNGVRHYLKLFVKINAPYWLLPLRFLDLLLSSMGRVKKYWRLLVFKYLTC